MGCSRGATFFKLKLLDPSSPPTRHRVFWLLDCNRFRLQITVADPGYRYVPGFPVTPYFSWLPISPQLPSDRVSDRATEKSSCRAIARPSNRATERSSDQATERASERPTERQKQIPNSSLRSPFDTSTRAFCILFPN